MQVDLSVLRYNPERDKKPHWETYVVESEPWTACWTCSTASSGSTTGG